MPKIPLVGRLSLLLILPTTAHAQGAPLSLTSPGPETNGRFGTAVASVPDVGIDGHADFLVGASAEDGGATDAGRVYLYSGIGGVIRTLTSPTPEAGGHFGLSVAGVPDADADGRGDLLVGAPGEAGGAGRAYLFSGATGALLRTLTNPHPQEDGAFGGDVAGLPTSGSDGRGLLVGAAGGDGGADGAGRAYYVETGGAPLRGFTSPNPEDGGGFGASVAGVPDANGDGFGDLLVSAWSESAGAGSAGRVYLFSGYGGARLRTLVSPHPESLGQFGVSVSGVPDANGDGRGDLLVGANSEDGGARDAGRAYLFSGATGTLLRTLTSPGREEAGRFGTAVAGVADANADGRGDLLVGAPLVNGGAGDAGRAYLFSGASGALLRTLTSPAPEAGGHFGFSAAGVPDTDGDGRSELLVGAPRESGGAADAGRAYLFASGRGLAVTARGIPSTIAPGGTAILFATASNISGAPVTLDLWYVLARGGTPVQTRFLERVAVTPGVPSTRSYSLLTPPTMLPGAYTVTVHAGTFPGTALASDAFVLTVTGGQNAGGPATEPGGAETAAGGGSTTAASLHAGAPTSSPVVPSPNPFEGRTALRFSLAEASRVRLSVHDVLGREVARLVDGPVEAGAHTAVFDAHGLAGGVYVWRLATSGAVQTGRLTQRE